MEKKGEYAVVEILGILFVFVTLVLFLIPSLMKLLDEYKVENFKLNVVLLINTAKEEFKTDKTNGLQVNTYCYSDRRMNTITYTNGFKSLSSTDNDYSYFITLDKFGEVIKIAIKSDEYALVLLKQEEITEENILSVRKKDFNSFDAAYKYINRCPDTSI